MIRGVYIGIMLFILAGCGQKKEVLLPKLDRTIIKEVRDWSAIYLFFRIKGKDSLCEVNRRNSIGTTNWILHIDKRLPLRLVVAEVIRLQNRKKGDGLHKNEKGQNYYSYADTIGKNIAFLPFTQLQYKMQKPKNGYLIYFSKSNAVMVNGINVDKKALAAYLKKDIIEQPRELLLCFDKDMSFGTYMAHKVYWESLNIEQTIEEEAVY